MKKTITKVFSSMRQAVIYRDKLYNKYDSVKLISFPMYSEYGEYTWEVE